MKENFWLIVGVFNASLLIIISIVSILKSDIAMMFVSISGIAAWGIIAKFHRCIHKKDKYDR